MSTVGVFLKVNPQVGDLRPGLVNSESEPPTPCPSTNSPNSAFLTDERWADAVRDYLISQHGPSAARRFPSGNPTGGNRPACARAAKALCINCKRLA
jgi:hypothetical protein